MSLILDIYQSRRTLVKLQQVVQQLKQDTMQQMDVPVGQKEQVKNKLRDTVKQTVVKKVNGKIHRINYISTPCVSHLSKISVLAFLDQTSKLRI